MLFEIKQKEQVIRSCKLVTDDFILINEFRIIYTHEQTTTNLLNTIIKLVFDLTPRYTKRPLLNYGSK